MVDSKKAKIVALHGGRKGKEHWNPTLPTEDTLTITILTSGKLYTFERTPGLDPDNKRVAMYHGYGFAIRIFLEPTEYGKRMMVMVHHNVDMPNVMTMMGLAYALAPEHVKFAIMIPPVQALRRIIEETDGFALAMYQVILGVGV